MFPTPQQFSFDLQVAYFGASEAKLAQSFLQQFVDVFIALYLQEFPFPLPIQQSNDLKLKIAYKEKAYHLFLKACAKCLVVFTAKAPMQCLEQPAHNAFLTEPGNMFFAICDPKDLDALTSEGRAAFGAMAEALKAMQPELKAAGIFDWQKIRPEIFSYTTERHPGEFEDYHRVSWSDASDAVRNAWRRREEKYEDAQEKALRKASDEAYKSLTGLQRALLGTPLFPFAYRLSPNESTRLPFELPLVSRFKHQWVISPSGGGKTTLLESQIIRDLDKVARGECSVVVIDSQAVPGKESLIPNIAWLKVFAPGQPLAGKLVLLEPDPEYPLALNMFDRSLTDIRGMSARDRDMYDTSAAEMIQFCLSAMTDQQDDLFAYVVQFLMIVPDATIDDLVKILAPKGLDNYRQYLDKADPSVQTFFNTMFDGKGFQVTRDAVLRRVAGVLKNRTFRHMFQSKRNKFSMLRELSEPKVILINTDMAYLGPGACQLFGRFFISQLVQMVQVRGAGLPVFCYIDELQDYLSDDPNLEFLNDKARKRNVGMIYAHQRLSNIKSEGVRDSLCNVDIQFAGGNRTDAKLLAELIHTTPELIQSMEPGNFMTFVKGQTRAAVQLEVKELLPLMARMTDAEMRQIKREMRERYARPLHEISVTENYRPQQERPTDPPKDGDYDDRYDILQQITLHPAKARSGTVLTVKAPNGREYKVNIPAGTHNGYRFLIQGASGIRRPDNRNGNFWVELEIPDMPGARKAESRRPPDEDDTDAKPW
jgi:hypothetical protein